MNKLIAKGIIFKQGRYPAFKCGQCGECCEQTPSITMSDVMRLKPEEQSKIELHNNELVTFATVKNDELTFVTEKSPLIISPSKNDKCVFYNGSCSIHERKPAECSLNPFSINVTKKGNNFIASAYMPNYCEGIKKEVSANHALDDALIKHLKEMIKHEYFIITLKEIPKTINELITLWLKQEDKKLIEMLNYIHEYRAKEGSELLFRTCC